MYKKIKIFFLIALLTYAVAANAAMSINDYDPKRIAHYETTMWKAYYKRNYQMLLQSLVSMLSEQFNLSGADALTIAASATQAARLFSQMPARTTLSQYHKQVLPSLILFYTKIKQKLGGKWEPKAAATAELKWWIARRIPGKNKPEQVGRDIADLYVILYGARNEHVELAGYLRAKAAYIRDRQSRRGKIDWPRIEKMLVRSYQNLLLGIKKKDLSHDTHN